MALLAAPALADIPDGTIKVGVLNDASGPFADQSGKGSVVAAQLAADDFARLPRATEAEEDLLDLAPVATRTSRLSCQIRLTAALDGLRVRVPAE